MSIYSTLWRLQFPRNGDAYTGCEWVEVFAQGVPAHVGTPTLGCGYESGDPYAAFLPPALRIEDAPENNLRAVVFIIGTTRKGTPRAGQEYESPLLMLTGAEYAVMPFQDLHDRLCDALRGSKPRLVHTRSWKPIQTTSTCQATFCWRSPRGALHFTRCSPPTFAATT